MGPVIKLIKAKVMAATAEAEVGGHFSAVAPSDLCSVHACCHGGQSHVAFNCRDQQRPVCFYQT